MHTVMTRLILMIAIFVMVCGIEAVYAQDLLMNPEKLIGIKDGQIPQAARVSPDGQWILFEYYTKERTNLWQATADGQKLSCLTCDSIWSYENGFWHPSGKYIVFNAIPSHKDQKDIKIGDIVVASYNNGSIKSSAVVATGARSQFSRPNGHVIFFEKYARLADGRNNNILSYRVLGKNPLQPTSGSELELRGPIQIINQNAEVSHPSLAPDGTTIVFAARATNIKTIGFHAGFALNDIDRQKVYKLWQKLITVDKAKINKELASFGKNLEKYYGINDDTPAIPKIGNQKEYSRDDFELMIVNETNYMAQPTIIPGFVKRHLLQAWALGLLDMLDKGYDAKVQEMIFPRLWITDVFGAPIKPLVKDLSSTALPQKWPTISHDGKFVVFEAGHYSDRHVYLVAKKGNEWMERAIKITESGTYNSSPEIDHSGQWLYFESNRDGSKAIWRAKLNWPEINKRLGL